jgi:hypothetical protein
VIYADTPVLDYAPGEGMKKEGHEEIYRVAFESANSELKEISSAIEELRIRKDFIEKLISVLAPVVELEKNPGAVASEAKSDASEEPAKQVAESKSEEASDRLVADPFQRRIDHVLGIGAGIRDVRKYTRQF